MLLVLPFLPILASADEIKVDSDFPGGSGEVERIDSGKKLIVLNPSDYPDRGWRCWWYVKIDGIPDKESWTLDVGEAPWATPDRATFSSDGGRSWQHTEPGTRDGKRIRYTIVGNEKDLLVAWGPP